MKLKHLLFFGLSFVVATAVPSVSHARMLHESARIAVYSTEAEPQNRNSHPVAVAADRLSAALSKVRVRSGETGEIIDLFPEKNREEAAARLAKELRRIDPAQELHLVSFRHLGTLFSGRRNASAARVFVQSGRLNLIFGQIDLFFSEFRDPDRHIPPMGSRERAATLKERILPAEGLSFVDGRNDWIALELDLVPPTPLAPAGTPAAGESIHTPVEASPKAPAEPREKSVEEKLQLLKILKDKNLITDQEYKDKKRDILDNL